MHIWYVRFFFLTLAGFPFAVGVDFSLGQRTPRLKKWK